MGLNKLFVIGLLVGTLGLIGCGSDDGGGGGTTGTGGSNGGGGAAEVCSACDNQALRSACEGAYHVCIQDDAGTPEDCAVGALLVCDLV